MATSKLLGAVTLIILIAVPAITLCLDRDLPAAFLMFCIAFGALGMIMLVSFLVGVGIVHCFDLLVDCASSLRRHKPVPSVVGHLRHGGG